MNRESLDCLIEKIKSFQDLPYNWDTYGGKPACSESVDFCIRLLKELQRKKYPLPFAVPISRGVFLNWGRDFYFEVDDDGLLVSDKTHSGSSFGYEDSTIFDGSVEHQMRRLDEAISFLERCVFKQGVLHDYFLSESYSKSEES